MGGTPVCAACKGAAAALEESMTLDNSAEELGLQELGEEGPGWGWLECNSFLYFSFQIIFQSTMVSAPITSALVQVLTISYLVSSLV